MRTSTKPNPRTREIDAMPASSGRLFVGLVSLALVGLLLATALPSLAQREEPLPPEGLIVTYLLYSGLPNPTFTVTDPAEVADLQRRIGEAQEAGTRIGGEGPEPVLGYNGIMIEDLSTAEQEDAAFYVVKGDLLRLDGGNPEDPSARSTTVSAGAAEIESSLIDRGLELGVIDERTASEMRDPRT